MKIFSLAFLFLFFASSADAVEWRPSCNSIYEKHSFNSHYTFRVKHRQVGGCPSDKLKQEYFSGSWDWSERSEVKSKGRIGIGNYTWSADINIQRNCKPAHRNTLFQVHAGGYLVSPPSWFGINRYNKFRTNQYGAGTSYNVPNETFKLTAEIDIRDDSIEVDYFINNEFVASTKDHQGPYEQLFFKFGVYRVNSNCDITQKYFDVKLEKTD